MEDKFSASNCFTSPSAGELAERMNKLKEGMEELLTFIDDNKLKINRSDVNKFANYVNGYHIELRERMMDMR